MERRRKAAKQQHEPSVGTGVETVGAGVSTEADAGVLPSKVANVFLDNDGLQSSPNIGTCQPHIHGLFAS